MSLFVPFYFYLLINLFLTAVSCYFLLCLVTIQEHTALPDVLALEAVLRHPSLCGDLESLPFRSPQLQTKLWVQQKRLYTRASKAVGKPSLTSTQAKKLDALGFTFQSISLLRQQCSSQDKFQSALKERGVRSKPLREKLWKALLNPR